MKIMYKLVMFCLICGTAHAQVKKEFKWVDWKNVSATTKTALKKIHYFKEETAYDNIIETLEEDCDVSVAVLDMDGDGKLEYAVGTAGNYCCGSAGCGVTIYKDAGRLQINLTDYWESIKPVKAGVLSSTNHLFRFQRVTK